MRTDGPLCVRGGCLGKRSNDGHECSPLPAWEQSYLREAVFGSSTQSNFAAASFGEYDGAARLCDWPANDPMTYASSSSSTPQVMTPTTSTSSASSVKSVQASTSGLASTAEAFRNQGSAARVHYGEGSAPSKRPADPEVQHQQRPAPFAQQEQQAQRVGSQNQVPQQMSSLPQQAGSQPQYQPQQIAYQQPQQYQQPSHFQPIQRPPLFANQASQERPKRKGQRRVGKRVELQPLVGMYNDSLEGYESAISIRQVMQNNKIDMTWMDVLAWSPAMCKELKRLCTRVTKKRVKKPIATQPQQPIPLPPYPLFQPQFATAPVSMPQAVPQATRPVGSVPMESQVSVSSQSTVAAQPDAHTRRLSTMAGIEKAYHIPGEAKIDGVLKPIEKKNVNADQGSEMNVISPPMVKQLGLTLKPLSEVGFVGLCMETADHRETLLHNWVMFDFCVAGIWRVIRCS